MASTAFIMCGALAHEVVALKEKYQWDVDIVGIDAAVHVRPEKIAPDVETRILNLQEKYDRLIVLFGDCGSQGELDKVLTKYNIERIAGPHCYEMFGGDRFQNFMDEEPGTFFLTDFMVRSWKGMIVKSMGLDRFPSLKKEYFVHYKRLVYFVQKPDPVLMEKAKSISKYLNLPLEIRATGYNLLEERLVALMNSQSVTA